MFGEIDANGETYSVVSSDIFSWENLEKIHLYSVFQI